MPGILPSSELTQDAEKLRSQLKQIIEEVDEIKGLEKKMQDEHAEYEEQKRKLLITNKEHHRVEQVCHQFQAIRHYKLAMSEVDHVHGMPRLAGGDVGVHSRMPQTRGMQGLTQAITPKSYTQDCQIADTVAHTGRDEALLEEARQMLQSSEAKAYLEHTQSEPKLIGHSVTRMMAGRCSRRGRHSGRCAVGGLLSSICKHPAWP
eukprot:2225114-Amphidinium_carterae.1